MKHFPVHQIMALPDNGYCDKPTKLRIVRQGDDLYPWVLDGYDTTTGAYTERCWTFATFAECVAAIPAFHLAVGPA